MHDIPNFTFSSSKNVGFVWLQGCTGPLSVMDNFIPFARCSILKISLPLEGDKSQRTVARKIMGRMLCSQMNGNRAKRIENAIFPELDLLMLEMQQAGLWTTASKETEN